MRYDGSNSENYIPSLWKAQTKTLKRRITQFLQKYISFYTCQGIYLKFTGYGLCMIRKKALFRNFTKIIKLKFIDQKKFFFVFKNKRKYMFYSNKTKLLNGVVLLFNKELDMKFWRRVLKNCTRRYILKKLSFFA